MPKPERHVFICTQARPAGHPRGSCGEKGCAEVFQEFLSELEKRQVFNKVQVTASGCLGPCPEGTNVIVYPEGVMYSKVSREDVNEIFDQHLLEGKPVERLLTNPAFWS